MTGDANWHHLYCWTMTAVTRESLRERKKRKTQQALQAAAIRLMTENGFDNTTIEQIADAAEVSPRTFFRYFATKEAVLLTDLQDEIVAEELARAADGMSIIDAYEAAVTVAFNELTEDEWAVEQARMRLAVGTPELWATFGSKALRPLNDATAFIAARLGAGPDDVRPHVYAAMLLAAAGASVVSVLPELADASLERSTLLEALHAGLDLLRAGFPTGIDEGVGHNGRVRKTR